VNIYSVIQEKYVCWGSRLTLFACIIAYSHNVHFITNQEDIQIQRAFKCGYAAI